MAVSWISTSTASAEIIYSSVAPLRLQTNGTQCSDTDRQIWQSTASNNRQFFNNIDTCGKQAAGATDITTNVTSCMTQIYPDLSENCAKCYGSSVDCGATNCRVPCQAGENTSECQTCLQPCTAALASCAGTTNLPESTASSSNSASSLIMGGSLCLWTMMIAFM
jgi:hypothetical protein